LNGINGFGEGTNAARHELDLSDGTRLREIFVFAANVLAIGERRGEMHVGDGGGKDAAALWRETLLETRNGFGEIAGHVGEGGKEQVAKIMGQRGRGRH